MKGLKRENMTWGRRAKPSFLSVLSLAAFLVLAWCIAGLGASQAFAASDTTPPPVPSLVSPADTTLTKDNTPSFDWTDVADDLSNPVSYRIQIDNNSSFLSPERDQSGLSSSDYTDPWGLGDGTYYWRVKAVDGVNNESAWSDTRSLTIDASIPPQPNLTSPSDWTKTNDTTPNLDWSDVIDTSGVSYTLQIASDSGFASVVLTKQGLSSSDYTLSAGEALAQGTYYWQVRTVDGAGNGSGWSGYWRFTVDTTAPAAPTMWSPSDGATTNSAYPGFDWSDVNDPSGVTYTLQIASDASFASVVLTKQGLNNSDYGLGSGEALSDGTYYWRVKAIDNAGNSGNWSNSWSLTVDTAAPSTPNLVSPANSVLTNNNKPSFDWSDVNDPSGVTYRIQVDNNVNFSSPERDQSGISSSIWTMDWNLGDGTYYWRVKAIDGANNESAWTAARSLTIDASIPPQPNLASPSDWAKTNDTTPNLDWSDVIDTSGVSYTLQIASDSGFASVVLTKQGLSSSDYTLSAGEALAQGTYYWRVKAVDGVGNDSGWSYSWRFTVDTSAPAPPNLMSPSDGTATGTAYPGFDWSDVNDPSGVTYTLQIASDASFASVVLTKQGLNNSDYGLGSGEALSDGTYYWRVKAIDNAGNSGNWSNSWSLTVDTAAPSTPNLVSPANSVLTNNNKPSFDWSDVTDSSGVTYRIQVDNNVNFSSPERDQSGISSSIWTMDWNLGDSTYYWRVKAIDGANNESAWTAARSLTIDASIPPQPNLMAPSDWTATNDTTPSFDWADVTDTSGVSYSIQIDDDSYFSSPVLLTKQGLISSNYTLDAAEALAEGEYYWRVKAVDGAGNDSGWSYFWRFTVDTSAPAQPNLVSPSNGGAVGNPTPGFDWSDVNDPSGVTYTLQIASDASFASVVLTKQGLNNSDYGLGSGQALSDGTYYWRVKAVDKAGNSSNWSSFWSFMVDTAAPPTPSLLLPADGALTNNNKPSFDWSDVTDASAVSYRIQVDNNVNFSSPERDQSWLGSSDYTEPWGLGDGKYYWRVKVADGANNESAWTAAWSLTIDAGIPPQPNLMTPFDWTATADTTPSFDWSDITDSSGVTYTLQIDDDSYFSSPVLLAKQGLAISDYTLDTAEALAGGKYYWRVKAVDGAGNDSGWSYFWTFSVDTTAPAVPVLASPPDASLHNKLGIGFDWSDIGDPSGVTYTLQISGDASFGNVILDQKGLFNSDYGLGGGGVLADGAYYWRVKTIDGAGNESGWSNSWSFAIDTIASSVPSLLSPAEGTSTKDPKSIDFKWSDVSDPSGVHYNLQIAWDRKFLRIEHEEGGIVESHYLMPRGLPDATYYWRVKAIDGANNESGWSDSWAFTVAGSGYTGEPTPYPGDGSGSLPPVVDKPGSEESGSAGGPPIPVIGGGLVVLVGGAFGYLMIRKSRRKAALRREFQGKLERWEAKGYDVSVLRDKWFSQGKRR